ncbi:TESK1 kinase, partial [Burhinus bistriatus]|nr:TESK1 kinase [Burhinus bistriatus]
LQVRHRQSGQIMVLKMNKLTSNRGNMLREVQLMNRLSHPNILRFMGVCVHQGQLHALTEYINGGNLEQLLDSPVPLSWSTRVKLALDVARGLRYLHSKGIFHRDLTSKNCLVRCEANGYTAVVGDFGLAEKIPTYSEGSEKEPLAVVGSPYWMAPEVLRGEIYNEKADVFAYGIILCEIIARIPADPDYLPRTEDFGLDITTFRTMVGIDCPATFLQLAFHCCSMEPTSRPSFLEITQCLEGVLQHQPELLAAGDLLLCPCPGLAGRAAGRAEQSPLRELGTQHLQPDQRLSRSQSDMFPPKSPALLRPPEPYGGARTKEMSPRPEPRAPNGLLFNNNHLVVSKPLAWGSGLEHGFSELSIPCAAALERTEHTAMLPGHGSGTVLEQDEVLPCPGCCLGPFSFASVCHRMAPSSPHYQNLNCEAKTLLCHDRGRHQKALGPVLAEPSLKLPEAQS